MRTIIITFLLLSSVLSNAQLSKNVSLLGRWTDSAIPENHNGSTFNDVWGFEINGEEFAAIGSTLGTHIIWLKSDNTLEEVSFIEGKNQHKIVHRDFCTYKEYLYAVCDQGSSSLQIIDLSNLPHSAELVHDNDDIIKQAHNVFCDENTGKIYLSGTTSEDPITHEEYKSGAIVLDAFDSPENPTFFTEFNIQEYVHDTYVRNDTCYFHCAGDGMKIYLLTDNGNFMPLGSLDSYGYNHSGWPTENGEHYVFAEESQGKKLKICDITDLSDIDVLSKIGSGTHVETIAHNVIVKDDIAYVSYYFDGLQIIDIADKNNPKIVGYYDTHPQDFERFSGAWGVYPLLESQRILISDRQLGLFLFKFHDPKKRNEDQEVSVHLLNQITSQYIRVQTESTKAKRIVYDIYDLQGKLVKQYRWWLAIGQQIVELDVSDLSTGTYVLKTNKTVDKGSVFIKKD